MPYIYGLVCPVAGCLRYIGKTDNVRERLSDHIKKARYPKEKTYRARWIRTLLAQDKKPSAVVLMSVPNSMSWQTVEGFFISTARYFELPITNTACGGEGGWVFSDEVKARHAAACKINAQCMKDPQMRARLSAIAKNQWSDPDLRSLRSELSAYAMRDPENRKRSRQGALKQNSDPDYKRRRDVMWAHDDARKNAADAARRGWSDPVKKAARVAALKAAWARRKAT